MVEVSWSPQAIRDLFGIQRYIGLNSPLAAQRVAVRLQAAGDSLGLMPERGRPASGGAREVTVIYPYVIRYRAEPKLVRILRIKHGAQRPG
nr:type II toxin-antitoxin system RelE/ParE family toxin [Caulobacter sp. S45]